MHLQAADRHSDDIKESKLPMKVAYGGTMKVRMLCESCRSCTKLAIQLIMLGRFGQFVATRQPT